MRFMCVDLTVQISLPEKLAFQNKFEVNPMFKEKEWLGKVKLSQLVFIIFLFSFYDFFRQGFSV